LQVKENGRKMVDFGDSIPGKFSASNETYARSTIILIMWHMYRD